MEALIYKGLEGVGFTEVNPDKGTETITRVEHVYLKDIIGFTEVNPDKGTETKPLIQSRILYHHSFTEVNPDKGTETGY